MIYNITFLKVHTLFNNLRLPINYYITQNADLNALLKLNDLDVQCKVHILLLFI